MNVTELQVNLLLKAPSIASQIEENEVQKVLRSYYLLRCKKLIGSSRLPQKHFSQETRCSHCFMEWTKETASKASPIKLSKRQRRRIRSNGKINKKSVNKEYLLNSKNLEKVCSFCGHITKTPIYKPTEHAKFEEEKTNNKRTKVLVKQNIQTKKDTKHNMYQSNVYCDSKDAFSLSKQNTLSNLIKESPKIIKNNERKKNKLAGLCRTAVIAAIKLKQEKEKQNKLNLFLKPSL